MRILQLHTHYRQPGGEDRAVATEASVLRQAGHEVLTHRATNPDGPRAALTFAAAVWNPAAGHQVRRLAAEFRPDVAHVHNTWFAMSPAVLPALHSAGIPVVVTLHNYRYVCSSANLFRDGAPCTDCVGTHPGHAVVHRCYRGSLPQSVVAAASNAVHDWRGTWQHDVDQFLALTEFGRQQFIAGGLPPERIAIKSNSVSDPGPRNHPPSASRTVVFVGRLSEEKGVDTLLDAWKAKKRELDLVVVGTGPLDTQLRQRAPASVRFLGAQSADSVAALMLSARALVFPSIGFEGQGLVALEAAAAGLPVIVSDLGAMTGLFEPYARELLFSPGDPDSLSGRLDALEDDAFIDSQGAIARRCFEDRYSHDVALERLERIYRELAPRPLGEAQ